MTIRFYLHNKAADGKHPIYMEVRWAKHATAEHPPSSCAAARPAELTIRLTGAKFLPGALPSPSA
jgi:hypothetical protein